MVVNSSYCYICWVSHFGNRIIDVSGAVRRLCWFEFLITCGNICIFIFVVNCFSNETYSWCTTDCSIDYNRFVDSYVIVRSVSTIILQMVIKGWNLTLRGSKTLIEYEIFKINFSQCSLVRIVQRFALKILESTLEYSVRFEAFCCCLGSSMEKSAKFWYGSIHI